MPYDDKGKIPKIAVNYRRADRGSRLLCSLCENWLPPHSISHIGTCALVSGPITSFYVCDLYEEAPRDYERYEGPESDWIRLQDQYEQGELT